MTATPDEIRHFEEVVRELHNEEERCKREYSRQHNAEGKPAITARLAHELAGAKYTLGYAALMLLRTPSEENKAALERAQAHLAAVRRDQPQPFGKDGDGERIIRSEPVRAFGPQSTYSVSVNYEAIDRERIASELREKELQACLAAQRRRIAKLARV